MSVAWICVALLLPVIALASPLEPLDRGGCPPAEAVALHVEALREGRPSAGFGLHLSAGDVPCARAMLLEALPPVLGTRVGYKAAFTGEGVQQRFDMRGPAWGAMFDRHLLPNGASLPAAFGAVPRWEPDLLVEVTGPGLADAASPAEALRHIRAVMPFVELPDLMLNGAANGHAITAINTGFRGGVLGKPIAVAGREQVLLVALESMSVVALDAARGTTLDESPGSSLMGHPLWAAIWLAGALRDAGIELQPGEMLSLGGFLPPAAPRAGMRLEVHYRGLPGDPSVMVQFTEDGASAGSADGPLY